MPSSILKYIYQVFYNFTTIFF